jgi:DNA-binding winged helix-turn-helix (wHTH) protein/TolB-like protein
MVLEATRLRGRPSMARILKTVLSSSEMAGQDSALNSSGNDTEITRMRLGRLVLDRARRAAHRDGRAVEVEPRVFDLLWYLGQRPGRICGKNELLDAVWGDRVVSESTLYRAVALARNLIGPASEARIRTVHGRGYELVGTVEDLSARVPRRPSARWHRAGSVAAAIVVVGAALATWWTGQFESSEEAPLPRVVLEFGPFSSSQPAETFPVDAFWTELRSELSRVDALQIADETADRRPRQRLQGHWRRDGEQIVAHAELVDLPARRLIWSANFFQPSDDIDALRHDMAQAVTKALGLESVNSAGETLPLPPTRVRGRYADYLKARSLWRGRDGHSLQRARALLERVVSEQPRFARAHEALASVYVVLPNWQDVDVDDTRALAWASAREALRIEPRLGEARAVLAQQAMRRGRWLEADAMFQAALAREPANATIRHWYAEFLLRVGHVGHARTEADEAARIDAIDAMPQAVAAWAALLAEDNRRAVGAARTAVELGVPALAVVEAWAEFRMGRPDVAAERIESLPNPVSSLLDCAAALRDPSRRAAAERRLAGEARRDELAEIYVLACRAMLSAEGGSVGIPVPATHSSAFALVWSRELSGLRASPAFQQRLASSRLTEYWRETRPPDGCLLQGEALVCRPVRALALQSGR